MRGNMPRPRRITLPDTTLHVVQRGHNKSRIFQSQQDCGLYVYLLKTAGARYETHLHAYVLMTNHVHLLVTSSLTEGVSRTMQFVASRYAAAVNAHLGRTGTLWESRFRSSPIDSDRYLLACYRYIELNPVRANIVRRPDDYTWSSFSINASARISPLISPHPVYLALGPTPRIRAERYRALVEEGLSTELIAEIREGLRSGLPAGSERFREALEASLARPIGRRRGRRARTSRTPEPPRDGD